MSRRAAPWTSWRRLHDNPHEHLSTPGHGRHRLDQSPTHRKTIDFQ